MNKNTPEWMAISQYYGNRTARRSTLPLIRHIVQGLLVLDDLGASDKARRAYCIHPLCQADIDLKTFDPKPWDQHVLMLAMEYRNTANRHLASMDTNSATKIKLSPLKAVNDMLIADKVQNKKDFTANQGLYENRFELIMYFDKWLEALGISPAKYALLCRMIDERTDQLTAELSLQ